MRVPIRRRPTIGGVVGVEAGPRVVRAAAHNRCPIGTEIEASAMARATRLQARGAHVDVVHESALRRAAGVDASKRVYLAAAPLTERGRP